MDSRDLLKIKRRVDVRHSYKIQELEASIIIEDKFEDGNFVLPLEITGVALTEGIHKDSIYYSEEELEMAAEELINKLVIIKHDTENPLARIGKVTKAWYNSKIRGIEFEAWIEDISVASKIYHGLINAVSVGVRSRRILMSDGLSAATDLRFTELSLVDKPADTNARIQVKTR